MKRKFLLLLTSLFCLCNTLFAQDTIIVYNSYSNFLNNTGEIYTDCSSVSWSGGGSVKMKLKNKKAGTKRKVKCSQVWGFSFNKNLFRSYPEPAQVVKLYNIGDLCYWENGLGNLSALWDKSSEADYSIGYKNFISKTIDSPLIALPGSWAPFKDIKSKYEAFKTENSQFIKLFNLIGENYEPYAVRNAFKEYEAKQKK